MFELPLAHHAVVAVDDDHAHRRTQARAKAAGIVLEPPIGFLRADEPVYIFLLAVIVIQPHRKLLTRGCVLECLKGGNALPLRCGGLS